MRPFRRTRLLLLVLLSFAGAAATAAATPPDGAADAGSALGSGERRDLRFPEPTSVLDVYHAWERAFGVHVVFDPRLKDMEIAIELEAVTAPQSLALITQATGHFHVVLDENAILIAADTPQNRRQYETQVIRPFYLENLELKDAMTIVRSLLGLKHIAAHQMSFVLGGERMRSATSDCTVRTTLLTESREPRILKSSGDVR